MPDAKSALQQRPAINDISMFSLLLLSITLSAADGIVTMIWLARGVAAEGNPIMELLIAHDPFLFFAVKMALTVIGLLLCYHFHRLRVGRIGLKLTGCLYVGVSFYHGLISTIS